MTLPLTFMRCSRDQNASALGAEKYLPLADYLHPAHVGTQHLGNDHAAIGLLVVL